MVVYQNETMKHRQQTHNLYWNLRVLTCLAQILLLSACTSVLQQQQQDNSDAIFSILAGEFSLRQGGTTAQALAHYNKAIEKTSNLEVLRHTAKLAFEEGDYSLVLRAAEKWSQLEPDNTPLHQFLAVIYLTSNNPSKAIAVIESLREGGHDNYIFKEISQYGLPDVNGEVLIGVQTVVEHFPTNALAQQGYATVALQAAEYEIALSAIERAMTLGLKTAEIYQTKASVLSQLNRLEQAQETFTEAIELFPEDLQLRERYVQVLSSMGLKREAYEQWLFLYQKKPNSPTVIQNLGLLSLEFGKPATALKYFAALKQIPGFNWRSAYYTAVVLHKEKKIEQALKLLKEVPAASGEVFEQAQLLAVRLYLEGDNTDQAIAQLEYARKAVISRESRLVFYLAAGEVLNKESLYKESFELYSKALEEFADDITLRQLRAFSAIEINDIKSMEEDLKYVLSVDASNVDALNMLGYTFADLNIRLDEAVQYLTKAYELAPDNPMIIDSMGWLKFRLNNLQEAEQLIRRAFEKHSDPEIYGHLVEVLRMRKKIVEATQILSEGLSNFPHDEYLDKLRKHDNPL